MTVLVHSDEMRAVWVLETKSLSGRWQRADMEPRRLVDLLEEHVEDAFDPDFIVRVRFRHIETGEVVDEGTEYDRFI